MITDINQLISRLLDDSLAPGEMLGKGVQYDSSKTVAFKSAKEIATLGIEYIPGLKQIIETEKKTDRRSKAYSILSTLAQTYTDHLSVYYIMEKLSLEKNKNLISLHLDGLSRSSMQLSEEVELVMQFAHRQEWQIRHSAIRLMSRYTVALNRMEEFLIGVLTSGTNEFDLIYSNSTLAVIGTIQSVECIKAVLTENKKTNVLTTGIYALGKIDGLNQIDFFIELMKLKKDSFVKSAITYQIVTYITDSRAVDVLIDRVKKIVSINRSTNMYYSNDQKPEIVYAMIYLKKYEQNDKRISELIQWIVENKMNVLDETEKTWVKNHLIAI